MTPSRLTAPLSGHTRLLTAAAPLSSSQRLSQRASRWFSVSGKSPRKGWPFCFDNDDANGFRPDVEESYKADVEALKKAVPGNEDVVAAITVGSETLYRGNFTGPELLKKINEVQKVFPKITIGTADSWNKYADGTADALIEGGVKYLYVSCHISACGLSCLNEMLTPM